MNSTRSIVTVVSFVVLTGLGCQTKPKSAPATVRAVPAAASSAAASSAAGPTEVLVGYFSLSGNTEKMAAAVAEGASQVEGVTVVKKKVAVITKADLDSAHGLILGCPTHFANIPAEMKSTIDHWAWKQRVNLTDKVGGAFSTGGNFTGGKEHVVISLLLYMLNNRMIVVGPIYREGDGGWGEIGASATTGSDDRGLSELELAGARRLGKRVAQVPSRSAPGVE